MVFSVELDDSDIIWDDEVEEMENNRVCTPPLDPYVPEYEEDRIMNDINSMLP